MFEVSGGRNFIHHQVQWWSKRVAKWSHTHHRMIFDHPNQPEDTQNFIYTPRCSHKWKPTCAPHPKKKKVFSSKDILMDKVETILDFVFLTNFLQYHI